MPQDAEGKYEGMPDIRAVKRRALEAALANRIKEYEDVFNQSTMALAASDQSKLQRQAEDIYKQIEKLDAELKALELAPAEDAIDASKPDPAHIQLELQSKLPEIDFRELEDAIRTILRDYRDDGCAALLLLQESTKMGGEWCAMRIRELLRRETSEGQFRHMPVEFQAGEQASRVALLRRLGNELGVESADLDSPSFSRLVVEKLCGSLQSGNVVMLELRRCDYLSHEIPWVLKDFWSHAVRELAKVSEKFYEVKLITVLFVDGLLPEGCFAVDQCCTLEQFKKNKLLKIPLHTWTRKDIREWIARYSGLPLPRPQIDRMANKIYSSTGGLPNLVANELLKECCPVTVR